MPLLHAPGALALALSLFVATASAADLRFEKKADVEKNFTEVAGKGTISFAQDGKGALRFTAGEKVRLSRIAYAPRSKPEMVLDDSVAAEFRFAQPNASFGLMRRVTEDASDCYVALVNVSGNGGMIRFFKGQPLSSYSADHRAIAHSSALKPGEWYRLEFSATARAKGVLLKAEVKPHTGGPALLQFEYEDQAAPLTKPGQVQLRFFAVEPGNHVDVKQVTIKPDKK